MQNHLVAARLGAGDHGFEALFLHSEKRVEGIHGLGGVANDDEDLILGGHKIFLLEGLQASSLKTLRALSHSNFFFVAGLNSANSTRPNWWVEA